MIRLRYDMIFLTKLDGKEFLLNELMIETVTETPDTVVVMSNGHSYIVRESMKEIQTIILEHNRRRRRYGRQSAEPLNKD